jgi:hypothetical protein
MRWLAALLLAATAAGHTFAQCKTIAGVVRDGTDAQPLPGATVRALSNPATGVITDLNGRFEWQAEWGDSVKISFVGYDEVVVVFHGGCEQEVNLWPSATGLDEVVIRSERLIAEEFAVSKINKLEIYTNPSARADPLLAVNALPAATTTDESANISLRGGSPDETGIFLNNVPINDAVRYAQLNGLGTFSIFNTALIRQVQVFPGNPPLEFGNTASGLIALSTDEAIPEKPAHSLSASAAGLGYFTSQRASAKSGLIAFANYQPSALLRGLNPAAFELIKQFRTADAGLHLFSRLNARTMLKVFSYANRESFLFDSRTPTYHGNFSQQKSRSYTVTNLRYRFRNSELSVNNGVSYSNSLFGLSTLRARIRLSDLFVSVNYQHFGKKGEAKAGLSYDNRAANFAGQVPRYFFALGDLYPVDSIRAKQALRLPEAYGYGKLNLLPGLTAGAGVRKHLPVRGGEGFWSRQANISFRPSNEWNIIASAGQYNKWIIPQGNAGQVQHIQTVQYSLDVNYTGSAWESSFSLFARRGSRNEIQNTVRGVEWFARGRISRHFRTQLSVTSLTARQTANGITGPSPFDIRYFIRGNMEYKFAGTWTATFVWLFREGSFYNPVASARFDENLAVYEPVWGAPERLPAYNLLDFSISKLLALGKKSSAVAFCAISNVPNFKNVRGYRYDFSYTEKIPELFSLRTIFFGMVVNW